MQKNKATIIFYLLIILVLVFPAINAIGERQVYARAHKQPPSTAREAEPLVPAGSSMTPDTAAQATPTGGADASPTVTVEISTLTAEELTTPEQQPTKTSEMSGDPTQVSTPTAQGTPTATPDATAKPGTLPTPRDPYTGPPSSLWKQWAVQPASLSNALKELYRQGIEQGNNPHAFSFLGDCQSVPDVFMGIYDQDPDFVVALPEYLQETVRQFGGSFERYSPTVKDGTTEGALLWYGWNDNLAGECSYGESPLDCELRVHQPSIVFIHVGTHWEARNRDYLLTIINKIMEAKAIPVLVTKADNRELDERVNQTYADLAAEYNLPMWNFWASVQHLPENGMEPGSDMYLSQEGLEVHRQGALEALDAIWRMANEME